MKRSRYIIFGTAIFIAAFLGYGTTSVYAQWTLVTPPTISYKWGLLGIHFASQGVGWAVGNDYANKQGALVHYQGETWTVVTPPTVSADWYLTAVHFTAENEGWAVGSDVEHGTGILLHYQGGVWTLEIPPYVSGSWTLNGVHFTSPNEGWAVGYTEETCENCNGYTGVLLHYQSGVWTSDVSPNVSPYWCLDGVHFASLNEGWAVGMDGRLGGTGLLLHYQNGTWTSVTLPIAVREWRLKAVHFTSADEGWAIGEDWSNYSGILLRYQNGAWTSAASPTMDGRWSLSGIHFTSPDEGWAVGVDYQNFSGALLHYQNGTWASVASPAFYGALSGVYFTSATRGWAVGMEGTLYPKGVVLHYTVDLTTNEGTSGTQVTIIGSGFGSKKGKVLIGGVETKLEEDGWKADSITYTLIKCPRAGIHYVTIKPYKAADIILSNAFTVKPPEIGSLDSYQGAVGAPITITGNYFGTKKGKVYLEEPVSGKKKTCNVTNWRMEPTNGKSTITFVVPKLPKYFSPGVTYSLKVSNKIGTAGTTFTVNQ